jgi:hypothetical protein
MRVRRTCARLVLACALVAVPLGVTAQQPRSEGELKAAYLFTFGRFVAWPERDPARDPPSFDICILGTDPFGAVLDATIAGATVRNRPVVARRLASAGEATACHILFISASEDRQLPAIVQALGHADVLTVSDMPRFVGRGGMIQFVTAGSRVRFDIDMQPAQEAGLALSSDLLRVANSVRREPGGVTGR